MDGCAQRRYASPKGPRAKGQRAQGAFGASNGALGRKGQRAEGAFGALWPGDQGAHGAFGGDSEVISSGWLFRMGGYFKRYCAR